MAQWVNYLRIVTPPSRKQLYSQKTTLNDIANLNSADSTYGFSSISWISKLMRGALGRTQRYKQYEAMDRDDVSRALDIIAEEMTNPDSQTDLFCRIEYQTEENQDITDRTITTLRAALRTWQKLQDFDTRTFKIARHLIKYGDVFFKKSSDTKKWEFIDVTRVEGIEVNPFGEVIAYHIKPSNWQDNINRRNGISHTNVEIYPKEAIIHFSLSDEMEEGSPFGMSLLQYVFDTWQKLTMLEQAVLIYRIVRAPERRVFFIDVGNEPKQRVKQYLQQIRNEIRQKRVPNTMDGNSVDSSYNPESIGEDYFFPVSAAGRGSRVETLPGGAEDFGTTTLQFFQDRLFRGLRVPTSYMKSQDANNPGSVYNDGKVGIAYIEELRFANFVIRLQKILEKIFDEEFKIYLQVTGINIDDELFQLKLPDPQNFAIYRQSQLDSELINSFQSVQSVDYLSKRFMLKKYLGLTEDEIQMNELMIRQEKNLKPDSKLSSLQQIYDTEAAGSDGGGFEPISGSSPFSPAPEIGLGGSPETPEPPTDTGGDTGISQEIGQ